MRSGADGLKRTSYTNPRVPRDPQQLVRDCETCRARWAVVCC